MGIRVVALLALLASVGLAFGTDSRPKNYHKAQHGMKRHKQYHVNVGKQHSTAEADAWQEHNDGSQPQSNYSTGEGSSSAIRAVTTKIDDGELEDTFFAGDKLFKDNPEGEREEVGGCILDKVMAIVSEGAHREHLPELKHDTAACCTKGNRNSCEKDLEEGYAILEGIPAKCAHEWHFWKDCYDRHAGKAASSFLRAVQRRVSPGHLSPKSAFFIARCASKPKKCMGKALDEPEADLLQEEGPQEKPKKEEGLLLEEEPEASLLATASESAKVETTTLVLR